MPTPQLNNNTNNTKQSGLMSTTSWLFVTFLAFHAGRYWDVSGDSRCSHSVSLLRSLTNYYKDDERALMTDQSQQQQQQNDDNGWHSIDVFYGNTSHLDAKSPPAAFHGKTPAALQDWYGQAQQDRIVYELLSKKKNGYFLDLASNDARTYSNTFALERHHNWTGLCVEPNPMYWQDLAYRSCQVVAAVVGRHRMEEVQFRFQTGVLGGIVDDKFDLTTTKDAQQKHDVPPTKMYTVPLLEILQRYNVPKTIDYLSLDVEGAEEYILGLFPLDEYHIKVMTIERPNEGLQALLKQHGFVLVQNLSRWGETLWAHESFLREQKEQQPQ